MAWNMAGELNSPQLDVCSSLAAIADGYDCIQFGNHLAVITGGTDDITLPMCIKSSEAAGILT